MSAGDVLKVDDLYITKRTIMGVDNAHLLIHKQTGEVLLRASGPLALQAMMQISHRIQFMENQDEDIQS